MADQRDYSIEELLLDDSFVHYCLDSDEAAVAHWEQLLAADPAQQSKAAVARRMLFALGIRLTKEQKSVEFAKLRAAVEAIAANELQQNGLPLPDSSMPPLTPVRRLPLLRWMTVAAAACLLLFAGYQWHKWQSRTDENNAVLAFEKYVTGNGERRHIELADGSAVVLNSNSELRIPLNYNRADRQLQLEGEAMFEVAKDATRPFVVNNNALTVKALGTVFKVRAYNFEPFIRTALLEGRVQLDDQQQQHEPAILSPGQWVSVDRTSRKQSSGTFAVEDEFQWLNGQLTFRDASLGEIAEKLQYWFGMEVIIRAKPTRPIHFNGEFVNRQLDEVLKAIAYVNNLRYSINDKQVTILDK
ncbi:FecR family protein [Flavihumibacter petaseus]|uniref:Putative anti-sigma factor n=1 Tax=Flavihumibacter petaseus NBRC 106054 TaxID=1220578 RepID=A0A0E9N2H1_9BACT|nr:FecR domain-containing protein [Flavihumibacter petaseus]GAO44202.1 putative anti-sigma factor [Flavihumibacter petaseus NBRC 106054]